MLGTVQGYGKETGWAICSSALLDLLPRMEMVPSPSDHLEDILSVGGRHLGLAAPGDKRSLHPPSKGHLKSGTLSWPAVILSGQCFAAEGRLLGLRKRAESMKEGMPRGKQLMV